MPELIGPLTAEEWCEFRLRYEDDLLMCCGTTSDFRDAVFGLLRLGDDAKHNRSEFRAAYWRLVEHGLPEGRSGELIHRLVTYFLGDPPEAKEPEDDMTIEEIMAELAERSGQGRSRDEAETDG